MKMMFTRVYESGFESCLRAPEASLLHVFWTMLRGKRDMPREDEFPLSRISYAKDDLMILRSLGTDWIYEHYGNTIAHHAGFDMTGNRVSDFKGALGDFYTGIYARVRRERQPLATIHRFGQFGERPMWERMILPLGGPDSVDCLYVINKVRELERDISQDTARARNRGLIVLQFTRDGDGAITDAIIAGANKLARNLINRQLDELLGHSMLAVLPGLKDAGIWDHCCAVAETQQPQSVDIDYNGDGIRGEFRVHISLLFDGITVDFEPLAPPALHALPQAAIA